MPSLKHIKRRISSVRSTRQITKAMDLVAAAKLQKMKARLKTSRVLFERSAAAIEELRRCEGAEKSVFASESRKTVAASAYVVMTGERGLCGGYNSNIIKAALNHMEAKDAPPKNEKIIAMGARGASYFRRRGKNIVMSCPGVIETAFYDDAEVIARKLIAMYKAGEIDEIFVAYTHFESTLSHETRVAKVLPVDVAPWGVAAAQMQYEPDPSEFLDKAVPVYLSMFLFGAMIEALLCEQAARMTSMNSATKNAEDIIDKLTLTYNRQRQQNITQEINEIVSGANALQ